MLLEVAIKNIRNLPEGAIVIEVTRSKKHLLSPSWKVLNQYKKDGDWNRYTRDFRKEMLNPGCINEMKKIVEVSKSKDVYLACLEVTGNCHRFLLLEWMDLLK